MNTLQRIWFQLVDRKISLLVWIGVWVFLSIALANFFNGFSAESELDQALQNLPETLRGAFNISSGFFTEVETFVAAQFLTLHVLAGLLFSLFMGVRTVAGRIDSGHMETLLTYRVSRYRLMIVDLVSTLLFWLFAGAVTWSLVAGAFLLITDQESISSEFFFFAFLGSFFMQMFGYGLGVMLGSIFSPQVAQGIGGIYIGVGWLLDGMRSIEGYPEWMEPTTPFYFFDTELLRDEYALDWQLAAILSLVAFALYMIGLAIFEKKDV